MRSLFKHATVALFALVSICTGQDMTTIHVDSDEAIHTETDVFGNEQRDLIDWADHRNTLNINLHVHVDIDGKHYCLESAWTLESGEMTRQEVAARIAIDFRTCLIEQGMLGQDAQEICSNHGATVLVTDTPRSDAVNTGTPAKADRTTTEKGGPNIVRYTDGPDGK